jgi:hypothetical protein
MSADEEKPSLPVSFEQLAELEDDFEQVDLELSECFFDPPQDFVCAG